MKGDIRGPAPPTVYLITALPDAKSGCVIQPISIDGIHVALVATQSTFQLRSNAKKMGAHHPPRPPYLAFFPFAALYQDDNLSGAVAYLKLVRVRLILSSTLVHLKFRVARTCVLAASGRGGELTQPIPYIIIEFPHCDFKSAY